MRFQSSRAAETGCRIDAAESFTLTCLLSHTWYACHPHYAQGDYVVGTPKE